MRKVISMAEFLDKYGLADASDWGGVKSTLLVDMSSERPTRDVEDMQYVSAAIASLPIKGGMDTDVVMIGNAGGANALEDYDVGRFGRFPYARLVRGWHSATPESRDLGFVVVDAIETDDDFNERLQRECLLSGTLNTPLYMTIDEEIMRADAEANAGIAGEPEVAGAERFARSCSVLAEAAAGTPWRGFYKLMEAYAVFHFSDSSDMAHAPLSRALDWFVIQEYAGDYVQALYDYVWTRGILPDGLPFSEMGWAAPSSRSEQYSLDVRYQWSNLFLPVYYHLAWRIASGERLRITYPFLAEPHLAPAQVESAIQSVARAYRTDVFDAHIFLVSDVARKEYEQTLCKGDSMRNLIKEVLEEMDRWTIDHIMHRWYIVHQAYRTSDGVNHEWVDTPKGEDLALDESTAKHAFEELDIEDVFRHRIPLSKEEAIERGVGYEIQLRYRRWEKRVGGNIVLTHDEQVASKSYPSMKDCLDAHKPFKFDISNLMEDGIDS